MFLLFSVLFSVWCFHHSTFSAQRYDNFQERQKHTLVNLLFWREWNLPFAKFLSVENNKPLKDLIADWMMGYQIKILHLCCSMVLLFRQSFISVAGCRFKPSRWIGKGFGAVYSPTEEETAPNSAWPFLILKEVWLPSHPTKRGKRMIFYDTIICDLYYLSAVAWYKYSLVLHVTQHRGLYPYPLLLFSII